MTLHLHAIDAQTGEIVGCPDCARKQDEIDGLTKELSQAAGTNTRLRRQIRELHGTEPGHERVYEVGTYWADRLLKDGYYRKRPTIRPGTDRWASVRERLREKDDQGEPEWDVVRLKLVVDGALIPHPKYGRPKREWLKPESIFAPKNIHDHFERAIDPTYLRLKPVLKLPKRILKADLRWLAEECDDCGHLRLEHSRSDPARGGAQPCLYGDCACSDFDDTLARAERWLARQRTAA